ncbi:sigma-54-dependent Fis family transcriptional regulator [Neomoorella humiferrea]|uniref:Acetoin dehydrogenase operon transcriptional activator AcoR n=1 Tax=Neomoorella humiferrea TaxID=676965 RepID=A0A2T0AUP8_9FIRM|nr:sigma 54-interacting transcriptional regulator [Moorella humiferrea]PRR74220.1 Acetoin dehydrogenase operon transcriptional activator AcoR [Moorella humiferrea]
MEIIRTDIACYDNQSNFILNSVDNDLFQRRWQEIRQCKQRFIYYNEDPRNFPCLTPVVADSWLRSYKFKIDPFAKKIGHNISKDDLEAILLENSMLISTTKTLIDAFKHLLKISGYMLCLHNANGTILYLDGDDNEISYFKSINAVIGAVWNEATSGTIAHGLSMILKCPVQLIGPEHYCITLENTICSAAPIMDEKGNLIGTLTLVQALGERPWEKNLKNLLSHTLGWVASLAVAIENSLKLEEKNRRLLVMNNTLETILSCIDAGVIALDCDNKIIKANREAALMLSPSGDKVEGRYIRDFVDDRVMQVLTSQKPVNYLEATIRNCKKERHCVFSIQFIPGQKEKRTEGAIIRVNLSEKINNLVNVRTGAVAKYHFDDIIGNSACINHAKDLARKFADAGENILLIGESGTGKELFAQAIHNQYRPEGPFVALNCSAIPRNLIESELFGYEGGTFTGAERNGRPGKIELAHKGTLFLDEIGDMPIETQATLLRVLEDKRVMRLGGRKYIPVDFRVIAATNKNLYQMVQENQFRLDLYFRLAVLKLEIPPLRQRQEDILLLCQHFIEYYCKKTGHVLPTISPAAKKVILNYEWPGNVRQLENAMIYAVNMSQDGIIDVRHLPNEIVRETTQKNAGIRSIEGVTSMKEAERIVIQNAMIYTGNNIPKAARLLGLGKSTLYRKLKQYNLDKAY